MPNLPKRAVCAALSLFMPAFAAAQSNARPDPADPKLGGAPVRYESAFAGYRAFTDEKVVSWRATNDLVQKLGGWQAFARDKVPDIPPVTAPAEDASAKSAPTPPADPPRKPGAGAHPGHR